MPAGLCEPNLTICSKGKSMEKTARLVAKILIIICFSTAMRKLNTVCVHFLYTKTCILISLSIFSSLRVLF